MHEEPAQVSNRDIYLIVAALGLLAAAVGLLITVVILIVGRVNEAKRQSHDAIVTHAALCTLRHQLQEQHDSSARYLRQHSDVLKTLGVSKAYIESSLHKQEDNIKALSDLRCVRPSS